MKLKKDKVTTIRVDEKFYNYLATVKGITQQSIVDDANRVLAEQYASAFKRWLSKKK